VKIYFFESESWIKEAWHATGDRMEAVWVQGMLTPNNTWVYEDAECISTDMSILNAASLKGFKQLKLIAVRSTGVDQIDLSYCADHQITVCNVPGYAQNAVAEHVFALLLNIVRNVLEAALRTRKLDFSWTGLQGFELRGKTIAVIGTGSIGRHVSAIARGFGMAVVAVDNFPDEEWARQHHVSYLSMDDALRIADIITLHVPGMVDTHHLLYAERFNLMRDGVVIINTARGDLIDSCALLGALARGKVAAAGLDVLPGENQLREENTHVETLFSDDGDHETHLANHLLMQHPKVIVTPHYAFFTKEASLRLMAIIAGNIEAFVRGEPRNIITIGTHGKD